MVLPLATGPVTWKELITVAVFPAHILLGLLSLPVLSIQLYRRSFTTLGLLLAYLPFYFQSAQKKVPGWKWNALFRLFDVKHTYKAYGGSMDVHVTEPFDAQKQYFIGVHPHGPLCFGRIFWHHEDLAALFKRDWRMLAASVLFRIPVIRDMTLFFGAVDAGRSTVEKTIKAGCNVVLYPGALDEANSVDAPDEVVLRTRTGFIRIAVQHGIAVLPMFCFGELDAVSPVAMLPKSIADYLQKSFRMSTTFFVGRWGVPFPRRVPMNLVVGRPVATTKCEEGPTLDAEVARVHAAFKQELRSVFEANQSRFGYAERKLIFACEQEASRKDMKSH